MKKRFLSLPAVLFTLAAAISSLSAATRQSAVTGGPNGIHPYLFKGSSQKRLVESARDHQWSLQFHKSRADTINIVAIRIEFDEDTSYQTTGSGLFGIRLGGDKEEMDYYESDTVYKYDALPHDSLYFARQLEAAADYYRRVSQGNLTLTYSIYPSNGSQTGYAVDSIMPLYSPGGKRKKESWDEYYERKTLGLITFVRDAILAADRSSDDSPFSNLYYDKATRSVRNELGHKTVFLIFHAGSSYLTDGGEDGALGQDTPSDMIDAFITPDIFKYFRDTLKLDNSGVLVQGKNEEFLIDELMMCSETSNQDGLNWGIQGIIVNQIARQIGIPDLFSTSSGISGIGAFCIMDFAGYSAGKGFIPPYPSAWVRAFMGWDEIKTVPIGKKGKYNVKALTSVIDRDSIGENPDTTILLIPLNDHEYYLIENRQRNLSGNRELFNYDTVGDYDSVVISSYPYVANIEKNVLTHSSMRESNVILRVRNNDIGIPASGLIVWHIDEKVVRDRISLNGVNADSSYRGVSLVEADGITDLGIMFHDIFYQAAFDYGGAEDVFPHTTRIEDNDTLIRVKAFGPHTFPSTRANDGGHSYLSLSFAAAGENHEVELTALGKNDGYHYIENISDSVFNVSVDWSYLSQEWPKRAAPGGFFDPLLVDIDPDSDGKELFLLDSSGRVYLWPATAATGSYNDVPFPVDRINLLNDTIPAADTLAYYDTVPDAFVMPSAIAHTVFVPSKSNKILLYDHVADSVSTRHTTLSLRAEPSSALCNYRDSAWAVGCAGGVIIFGNFTDTVGSVSLPSDKPVCALAALRESPDMVAAIQTDGTLSLVSESGTVSASTDMLAKIAISPFSLVTADLDNNDNDSSEIILSDSRQGMWMFNRDLSLCHGWTKDPSDWPSYYTDTGLTQRKELPRNGSAPSLADIDRDGYLDILIGGTNGLYAFNYKGALKSGWPVFLDKYYWYQRGSVTASPVVVTGKEKKPLIVYSSLTGDNPTYRFTKITRADRKKGIVWFKNETGLLDSIWDLKPLEIDTILTMNDSLIAPYTIPGGLCDAVNAEGKRPHDITAPLMQSHWPLSTGSSLSTSPMIGFMDGNNVPDLFAIARDGWIYRWELPSSVLPDTLFWPQNGFDNGRSFAFGGQALPSLVSNTKPIEFFSFPNPTTRHVDIVTFKYRFNAPATNVKLYVHSFTGKRIYSKTAMGLPPANLTGSYPDWNVHTLSVKGLAPGVYRCKLEATVDGKKQHKFWKMAIVK